jgi:DNA-binding MarR family transcriptional regulator
MLHTQQQDYVGLLIAVARRRLKQAVLSRIGGQKIALQQFWFLVTLWEQPGMSQSGLAERVRVDAPTASRVLAAMERRELVARKSDPRDRRRTLLALTPAGERLAEELARTAAEVRSAVVDGMSQAEVEALRRGLRKVIENMDRFESRVKAGTTP